MQGVSGTWRDLTENVNSMAANLTDQVRNIAQVTTAVAKGDLSQKITVDAKGEILELKNTINTMVDQLSSFADEVTRVAREVGTEGKLGGQAEVEGVSGTWRGLTENVNQLAGNLTTQVRAIAEVSTAVTQGDLTRSITVEAQGEVAELKDNINQMIANLRDTTTRNQEQDWLKTNLARISGLMQGQRDLATVTQLIMSELTPTVSAPARRLLPRRGRRATVEPRELRLIASYGYERANGGARPLRARRVAGRAGGARAQDDPHRRRAGRTTSGSAPGSASATPASILIMPILFEDQVLGVIELAWLRAAERDPPHLPRAADGDARRRAQHDHRQHAHRGAAAAVAVAERRARAAGAAARGAQPRHRAQEPRDRAGAPRRSRRRPSSWR